MASGNAPVLHAVFCKEVQNHLIPALDVVGKDYESGKIFLPQLMQSAEAAKMGFEAINRYIAATGNMDYEKKGPVVIATVKGDVHDIGKNICRALLENYGFRVVDLGRDVPPEKVLAAARRENARFVGLSALMTTTVCNMEATVKLLHEQLPGCKVAVGGAVLTADYAAKIGADFYSRNAMELVRLAERFFRPPAQDAANS